MIKRIHNSPTMRDLFAGVNKSIVGGATWTNADVLNSDEASVLIINPQERDTLFAGVQAIGTGGQGVYRSANRGKRWTNVYSAHSVACLDFDRQRPHITYAGTVTNNWRGGGFGVVEVHKRGYDVDPKSTCGRRGSQIKHPLSSQRASHGNESISAPMNLGWLFGFANKSEGEVLA